jgi:hypothetical protein
VSDKLRDPTCDKGVAGDPHGLVVVGRVQDVREVAERDQDRRVQGLQGRYRVSMRASQESKKAGSEDTYACDGLEEDKVGGVAGGPEERESQVEVDVAAKEVERDGRQALARAGDAVREDQGREQDGRDAKDVDEDIDLVGVVRSLWQPEASFRRMRGQHARLEVFGARTRPRLLVCIAAWGVGCGKKPKRGCNFGWAGGERDWERDGTDVECKLLFEV